METRKLLLLMFLVMLSGAYAASAQEVKKQYVPTRIEIPPSIDGILDEPVWQQGIWSGDFVQHEPNNGSLASQPTEFCVLFDDNFLYVGIRAFDSSPDSIVSRLTRRDNDDGDAVGIAFDSYYDQRTAFLFGVTAGGTRFDWIFINDGDSQDATWDPNWWVRTSLNDKGWIAEMRIPLNQLRFKKNGNGTWGLMVFRQIHRYGELSTWQHIPADAPGLVHRFAELKGMESVQPRSIFDVTPYMVSSLEGYEAQPGNPFAPGHGEQFKAGLDAKIGITSNFTLDLTLNPDFGQVEADPSQVNLSAFETFFQEQRPFFIEGRNITSFSVGIGDGGIGNDNLFYSRRIGRRPAGSFPVNGDAFVDRPDFTPIIGAAKITGKTQDGLSVGIIQSVTGETHARIAESDEHSRQLIEPLTNFVVGRVQKDINEGNTILGGMLTSVHRRLDQNLSEQMHRQAYSGGADFTQYFKDKNWMFNINAAFSHVAGDEAAILRTQRSAARYFQRPDAPHLGVNPDLSSMTGTGGRMQLVKASGHWNMMAAMLWKSPQFEINDIGYMREADQIVQVLWVGYRQWEPKGFYRSYNLNMNQYKLWTFGGENIVNGYNVNGFIRLKNYWGLNAGIDFNQGVKSTNFLRGGPLFFLPNYMSSWWGISTDNRQNLVAGISGNLGLGQEDYQSNFRVGPSITYKPADNFSLSFSPSYTNFKTDLQYVRQLNLEGDPRYIFGSIDQNVVNFSFRVNYTITPDLTVQYWGQPFVATGSYSNFKRITDPRHELYSERFQIFAQNQISLEDGIYRVDENGNGTADYQFGNPDFKVREFLSNLVVRWEYRPGSSLFFVWSQTRSGFENQGSMQYMNDLDDLFSTRAHNIFLLKFSYRWGVQ